MQDAHTLLFQWKFEGQPPFEIAREVRPDNILALPQLADDGFQSVTIRRAEELHDLICQEGREVIFDESRESVT